MTEINRNDPAVQRAVTKIRALRKLTHDTGNFTTRSQNEVLRSLPSEVLVTVAEILAEDNYETLAMSRAKNAMTGEDRDTFK
jgi:hypothetical protein